MSSDTIDIPVLLDWFITNKTTVSIDKETLLKELRQIPSCDGLSCFFCKDWAQFLYKALFNGQNTKKSAFPEICNDDSKRSVEYMCARIEKYVQQDPFSTNRRVHAEIGESVVEMVQDLSDSFQKWLVTRPHPWETQEVLKPIHLTTPSFRQDEFFSKDKIHFQLLKSISLDKNKFMVSSSELKKLKNIFTEENLSPKDYYCHDRGSSSTPTEIEAEVQELNEKYSQLSKSIEMELQPKIKVQWKPIEDLIFFIRDHLSKLENIVGAGPVEQKLQDLCRNSQMEEFIPFDNYWAKVVEELKGDLKQPNACQSVDAAFQKYLDFYSTFLGEEKLLKHVQTIGQNLQEFIKEFSDSFFSKVQKMDIPRQKNLVEQIETEARSSVQNLYTITDTRIKEVMEELQKCRQNLLAEMQKIKQNYYAKTSHSAHSRLDYFTKRDSKKKLKKLESNLQAILQFVKNMSTAFPSFYLVLVAYMIVKFFIYENNGREGDIIGSSIAKRLDEVKKYVQDCTNTRSSYNVGLTNGCIELSVVFAKAFFKEIQRQYFDWKAIKAQSSFLKSLEAEETMKNKKKSKKTKKKAQPSQEEDDEQDKENQPPPAKQEVVKPQVVVPSEPMVTKKSFDLLSQEHQSLQKLYQKLTNSLANMEEFSKKLNYLLEEETDRNKSLMMTLEEKDEQIEKLNEQLANLESQLSNQMEESKKALEDMKRMLPSPQPTPSAAPPPPPPGFTVSPIVPNMQNGWPYHSPPVMQQPPPPTQQLQSNKPIGYEKRGNPSYMPVMPPPLYTHPFDRSSFFTDKSPMTRAQTPPWPLSAAEFNSPGRQRSPPGYDLWSQSNQSNNHPAMKQWPFHHTQE